MQRFFGLPPSGELTKETLAVMKRPRCGLSDVEQFGKNIRWKKRTLSYRLKMITKQCSENDVISQCFELNDTTSLATRILVKVVSCCCTADAGGNIIIAVCTQKLPLFILRWA